MKKLLANVGAITMGMCLIFGLSACGIADPAAVNGTYYRYEAEQLDGSEWYELENGTWRDIAGEQGTYRLLGSKILFYGEDQLGESVKWATGTVKDGVLTISSIGVTHTYCMEGRMPSAAG